MPIYEYACTSESCAHRWEDLEKMTDPPQTKCPKCGKETAVRLMSRANGKVNGYSAANGYSKGR